LIRQRRLYQSQFASTPIQQQIRYEFGSVIKFFKILFKKNNLLFNL
jgi:hypothetical protein